MPRIKLDGLPEEFLLIKDSKQESYALVHIISDCMRQPAIGKWNYQPSLDECLLQVKALRELEGVNPDGGLVK